MKQSLWNRLQRALRLKAEAGDTEGISINAHIPSIAQQEGVSSDYAGTVYGLSGIGTEGWNDEILDAPVIVTPQERAAMLAHQGASIPLPLPKPAKERRTRQISTTDGEEFTADEIALQILWSELTNGEFSPNIKVAAENVYDNVSRVLVKKPDWSSAQRILTPLSQDLGSYLSLSSSWVKQALSRTYWFFTNIHSNGIPVSEYYAQAYTELTLVDSSIWDRYVTLMRLWKIRFPKGSGK